MTTSPLPTGLKARPVCARDGTEAVALTFEYEGVANHVHLVPLDKATALAELLMKLAAPQSSEVEDPERMPKPEPKPELEPAGGESSAPLPEVPVPPEVPAV
jgi:hypothetical protein